MARRKTTTQALVPTSMKDLKNTLWKAADKLRGSLDSSQYKDVVLGLIFLKYVSDAFEERRRRIAEELSAEGFDEEAIEESQDDPDEYLGNGVFWVHPDARWEHLVALAKVHDTQTIGQRITEAMDLLMADNSSLEGTLPRLFNRENVDQQRLGELLDLLNSLQFAPRPRASGAASSTRRPVSCGRSSRCCSPVTGASMIPAAARAACSCRPISSSPHTTPMPPTCRSTGRSSTRRRGGWPR